MMAQGAGADPQKSRLNRALSVAVVAAGVLYPFLIYLGGARLYPRLFLGVMGLVLGVRLVVAASQVERSRWASVVWPWILPAAVLLIACLFGQRLWILYWPASISL